MAMKKVKRKLNSFDIMLTVFAWLSFFVAIVFGIMVIFSTVAGTDNGKAVFGHKLLIVESDSMSKSPDSENEKIFFSSGDIIIIKPVNDFATVQEGDIITFISSNPDSVGETLSHKVRSVKKNAVGSLIGFETYGIYTGVSDKVIVNPDTVLGEYVGKIENLGTLFKFFKTPAGYFLGILIPCLLLLIFFSIAVGKLLGRKEMADSFDVEIDNLKGRVSQLENMDEKPSAQPALSEKASAANGDSYNGERHIELTVNALNRTIETLTRTIEGLTLTVEKPIETLAHTVEVLAVARNQNDVNEEATSAPVPEPPIEEAQPQIEESEICVEAEIEQSDLLEIVEEEPTLPEPRKEISRRCGEHPKCKNCPYHRKKLVGLFASAKRGDGCSKAKKCHKAVVKNKK